MPIPNTVQVTAKIAPSESTDLYATHDAIFGQGGLTHAASLVARDAISVDRRRAGMLCYVDETVLTYQLQPDLTTWTLFQPGGGGPPSGYIVGLPIATTVLDSVDPALHGTTKWAVEISKSSRLLVLEVVAAHDGVTASEMRPVSMQLGAGLFDVAVAVALVPGSPTGSLEISVTPASVGWSVSWQRIYTLPVPPTSLIVYNIPTDTYNLPTAIYGA